MAGPRGSRVGICAGALLLGVGAVGCSTLRPGGPSAPPSAAVLEIAALPQMGPAPLAVEFVASLEGPVPDEAALACPSVAWNFGDGPAHIEALNCSDVPQRIFRAAHIYKQPGAYEASIRLLGVGVEFSAPIQVIVQGATATPEPEALLGFPPAVLQVTPAPDSEGGEVAGALDRGSDNESSRAPAPGAPREVPAAANLKLPEDLYVLAGAPQRVWLRPAAGGPLELVAVGEPPIADLAVSAAGDVAVVDSLGIALLPAGGFVERLTDGATTAAAAPERGASGARDLTWSADGRYLAWRAEGVWVAERGGAGGLTSVPWTAEQVDDATGAPLAWDRGGALLIRSADGFLAVFDAKTATLAALPVRGAKEAGWLSSGPVAWLAGPSLRLITVEDTLQLTQLLDDAAVRTVAEAPPGRLLALVGQENTYQAVAFDLTGASLAAGSIGDPIELGPSQSAAWAASGTVLAIAGPAGLEVWEPATGRREAVTSGPVARAAWGRAPLPR